MDSCSKHKSSSLHVTLELIADANRKIRSNDEFATLFSKQHTVRDYCEKILPFVLGVRMLKIICYCENARSIQ